MSPMSKTPPRSPLRPSSSSSSASSPSHRSPNRCHAPENQPRRPRLDSREIPRTYSGLYGNGGQDGDLMPFELSRNRNTDWILEGGLLLLATYISAILVFELLILALVNFSTSFTITHTAHGIITLVYFHWIKGSPNFYEQGEMNAMTLWEQMDCTTGLSKERRTLLIIPTLLCYAACHFCNYDKQMVLWNLVVYGFEIIAKLPFMNGVRILGINRTTGIDDDGEKKVL